MTNFSNAPSSEKILNTVIEKIFYPTLINQNASIIAFRGSGRTSELKYLIRNINEIPRYDLKHLYGILDLSVADHSLNVAINELLMFFINFFDTNLDDSVRQMISERHGIEIEALFRIIHYLTHKKNLGITFIIDNFSKAYELKHTAKQLGDMLYEIKRINPMKCSFIFIADKEFEDTNLSILDRLHPMFFQNILRGKDTLFDEESTVCLFNNLKATTSHEFSEKFKKHLTKISTHDPSVIKLISEKALLNKSLELQIENAVVEDEIYEICKEELNIRYRKIINSLLPESLNYLLGKSSHPTKFLLDTGLVYKNGHLLNSLFETYINKDSAEIEKLIKTIVKPEVSDDVMHRLSGNDLLLYKLFKPKVGELVTKEQIAKVLWQDECEDKYSDWALDQAMSRFRASLNDTEYTLKTIKGKGYILLNN